MESAVHTRVIPGIACIALMMPLVAALAACTTAQTASGPVQTVHETQIGDATFYARRLHGAVTASGVPLDNGKALAAHRTYPFGTVVRVTNLGNGRSTNVVIVDRGPYGKNRREGAIIDVSRSAAEDLGLITKGQAKVKVEVLAWGNGRRLD